ncbi:hypothetical protein EZV62_005360 [Acer yangbiense]|uniref:GAG-pre-integrase domain-containing protein n=1 Tax=Acer yangbiense TaxID=1000413 RepID=A0A5C7IML8_9ROSI|nr:hypothetical protein EZV62_005360 [Acer yangbiense]
MVSTKFEIEKFNGKGDFRMWRKKMKAILVQQKCAKSLEEEKDLPVSLSAEEKQDLLETAYNTIILNLADNLFGFKMDQSKSLEDNLDDFTKLNIELANCDSKEALSDENQAVIVLNFLSDSYKDLKAAIKYGRDSLSIEDVLGALRSREMEMRSEKRASIGEGLNVRGRYEKKGNNYKGRGKSRSKSRARVWKCFECHKEGSDGILKISKGIMIVMKGEKHNGLYSLIGSTITGSSTVGTQLEQDKTKLWHMRLGHVSERGLKELDSQGLLCGDQNGKLDFCEHCIIGKQTRLKFSTGVHTSSGTMDYVHSDV